MPKETKVDKIELARIRAVQERIIEGHNVEDIKLTITNNWQLSERQAYRYIQRAYEEFARISENSIDQKRGFHLAARNKLLKWAMENRKTFALSVLQDMAKLEGLYVERIDQKVEVQGSVVIDWSEHATDNHQADTETTRSGQDSI